MLSHFVNSQSHHRQRSLTNGKLPPCFGKIEALVQASTRLLIVLERALLQFERDEIGWTDQLASQIIHIQRPYRDYLAGYDTVKDAEQKLLRKSEGFRQFCERTKEAMYDEGMGRVGLRELLMEPVQRVTRYILIFERMFLFFLFGFWWHRTRLSIDIPSN